MSGTPGPWRVSDSHGMCVVSEATDSMVADMSVEYPSGHWTGTREDAALISAAPDLLEACEEALETFAIILRNTGFGDVKTVNSLRAAISKARG